MGYSPWGHKESDTSECLGLTHIHYGPHVSASALIFYLIPDILIQISQ